MTTARRTTAAPAPRKLRTLSSAGRPRAVMTATIGARRAAVVGLVSRNYYGSATRSPRTARSRARELLDDCRERREVANDARRRRFQRLAVAIDKDGAEAKRRGGPHVVVLARPDVDGAVGARATLPPEDAPVSRHPPVTPRLPPPDRQVPPGPPPRAPN